MGLGIVNLMGIAGIILTLLGLVLLRKSRAAAAVPGFAGLTFLIIVSFAWLADYWLFPSDFDNPVALQEMQKVSLIPANEATIDAAEWPQWRGPRRDGSAVGSNIRSDWDVQPPQVVWQIPCGPGYSSPTIAGGNVYLQDRQGSEERVVCFDAKDGRQKWEYRYSASYEGLRSHTNGPRATPAIHDGRVYAVGVRGKFVCLEANPTDGVAKLLWEHDLLSEYAAPLPSWGVAGSPLIDGDHVIVQPGGRKATVIAFDRRTGEPRWTCLNESTGYSSPQLATLAGVPQIVAFTGKGLHGMDRTNGQLLWSYPWTTQFDANVGMPIIAGDHIFISSGYGTGCAAVKVVKKEDKLRVERVFERRGRLMRTHHASCVLRDGYIFGFDESRGDLKCIDLRDPKEERWASTGLRKGNVVLVNDLLLVLTEEGDLSLVEATHEAFRLRCKLPGILSGGECWATPAVVGSRIYLRDHVKLICLDAGPK